MTAGDAMFQLGPFHVRLPLAEGGMGVVWLAEDAAGAQVALKTLRPELMDDPRLQAQMLHEVRAVARLDHPHVLWIHDFGRVSEAEAEAAPVEAGVPWMALELCGGPSLEARPPRSFAAIRSTLLTLLDALAHAHARGLVHRDLKPANVLRAAPGDRRPGLKLADFGIAFAFGGPGRAPRAGTPSYMAPEQLDPDLGRLGPWTDLYALGCMAAEWACGSPPRVGATTRETLALRRAGAPVSLVPKIPVPEGFVGWIGRLLSHRPEDRFDRAADAAWALAGLHAADLDGPGPGYTTFDLEWIASAGATERPFPGWHRIAQRRPMLTHSASVGLLAHRVFPLVGRDAACGALWETLRTVCGSGSARAVLVRGPTGSGRTRMLRWLGERAHELAVADVYPVRCDGARGPLELCQRLVCRLLGVHGLPHDQLDAAVRAATAALALPDDDAADLAALATGRDVRTRWETASPLRSLCRALTRDRPAIVCLDDADQAPAAAKVARALLAEQRTQFAPILIVLTVPDDAPPAFDALEGVPAVSAVELEPLSDPAIGELLGTHVGLEAELRVALQARAGGVPAVALQAVREWVRRGVLQRSAGGLSLTVPLVDLPTTEDAAARLAEVADGLPDADRMLGLAAVLGPAVDEALWASACDDPEGLHAGTVALVPAHARVRNRLVHRLLGAGLAHETDTGWAFAHPALVEALRAAERRAGRWTSAHRAAALHVAALPMPLHARRLGEHWLEADAPDRAVDALSLALVSPGVVRGPAAMLAVTAQLETALHRAGTPRTAHAWAWLDRFRALAAVHEGRLDDAERHARAQLDYGERTGQPAFVADAWLRLGDIAGMHDDVDAGELAHRSMLRHVRALAQLPWIETPSSHAAIAYLRLARNARFRGDEQASRRLLRRAARLVEGTASTNASDALVLAKALNRSGGDTTVAREWCLKAATLGDRAGDLGLVSSAWATRFEITCDAEGPAEALAASEPALVAARMGGQPRAIGLLHFQRAVLTLELDRRDQALSEFRLARTVLGRTDTPLLEGAVELGLAVTTGLLDRWDDAAYHLAAFERLTAGLELYPEEAGELATLLQRGLARDGRDALGEPIVAAVHRLRARARALP